MAATKAEMGWNHPPFFVPEELAGETEACRKGGAAHSSQWAERLAGYRKAFPELAGELDRRLSGALPEHWERELPTFDADGKGMATRKASGVVLEAVAQAVPELVGGSADLAGSNNSYQKGQPDFLPARAVSEADEVRAGRNVHFGIREHAMGAAANGMALHGGVVPYGATFLIFSDYLRPALRLGALMGCKARYLFTHDSIGLGEDGPTHQPVEHLAALRAIPQLAVLRPADANEVRECWQAMLAFSGPAALILTRQAVPTLDRTVHASAEGAARGAYVVSDVADPKVILIGTGSELHLALSAQQTLQEDGIAARVVSMPSWELFEAQPHEYRESVLPPTLARRVVVEAGLRMGWERYVGAEGGFVTLDRFGASAPAGELYQQLGITAEAVVEQAKAQLLRDV